MSPWPKYPPILREMQDLRNEGVVRLLFQAVVVGGGCGAVIGCFRAWYTYTNAEIVNLLERNDIYSLPGVLAIFGTLLALALSVGWMVRKEPLLSGSGIPQVELAVAGRLPMPWLRIVVGKFVGTWLSLTGGLSVGREGPCIQMGAAVGCGFGRLWRSDPQNAPRYLIAGSVAGLTAAFGAPVAGMLFAFEELKSIVSVPLLLFTSAAAAAAWGMVNKLFGFGLVFSFADLIPLHWGQIWLAVLLGLGLGGFGALYNALLMTVTRRYDRQKLLPVSLKPLLPFCLSGILLYCYPEVLVGVGIPITGLENNTLPFTALMLLFAVKIAFSILSFASGVPGGLLMPMLGIGGLTGACAASLLISLELIDPSQTAGILVLCMGGLFASTVRAPLTGAALVVEMTGALPSLPELAIVALLATLTANKIGSFPIYDSLRRRIMKARARHYDRHTHHLARHFLTRFYK